VLSLTALLAVLSGYTQPPEPDEAAAAHIFQLSIVALVPVILLFLATADWSRPLRNTRPLAFPATASLLVAVRRPVLPGALPVNCDTTSPLTGRLQASRAENSFCHSSNLTGGKSAGFRLAAT
jgi:hypothetical protein